MYFLAGPHTCAYFQTSTQEAPGAHTHPFQGQGSSP